MDLHASVAPGPVDLPRLPGAALSGLAWAVEADGGPVRVDEAWSRDGDAATCRATLRNDGTTPVRLRRAVLRGALALDGAPGDWAAFQMGWNIAAGSGFVPLDRPENVLQMRVPASWLPGSVRRMMHDEGIRFSSRPGEVHAPGLTALCGPGGGTLVAGFTGLSRHFSWITLDAPRGTFEAEARLDGVQLDPGESRPLDAFQVRTAADPDDGLRAWAGEAARENGARIRPTRLWCSWYSGFYDRVDAAGLAANRDLLARDGAPLEFVQLDDGYQAALGDWEIPNDRFPGGLAAVAEGIRAAGFEAGVWTAPFAVSPKSRAWAEAPGCAVTDGRGRPVAAGFVMGKFGPRSYYALDTTRDDVLAATEARFRRLRDLGFRLFKLDFLTAASVAGVRADPKATRLQAYRRGMEAIRRGAGEDAVLLAGISPILANVGLFDVHRLGPDTCFGAPSWRTTFQRWLRDRMTPGAANNIAGSIQRAFTNDVLWSGDCDATLGSGLAPSELRLLVTVNLLLGSSVTVGHDLRTGPFDWAPLREIRTTGPARVLDRAAPAPAHLLARGELRGAPATFYAMVNTGDAARDLAPHPAAVPSPAEAPDYWTGERVALDPGRALALPARSVRLFVLSS